VDSMLVCTSCCASCWPPSPYRLSSPTSTLGWRLSFAHAFFFLDNHARQPTSTVKFLRPYSNEAYIEAYGTGCKVFMTPTPQTSSHRQASCPTT